MKTKKNRLFSPFRTNDYQEIDSTIFALAIPAFGQLIAEPLFILIDTAIVGHLGQNALAGLSLASSLLMTVVGLCVFLAYSTTSSVAQSLGAGKRAKAFQYGIDGCWLALAIGVVLATVLYVGAYPITQAMGADSTIVSEAVSYLRWSSPGIPAMLIVFATNGILRGIKNTKLPVIVAGAGAVLNTLLSFFCVYALNMGVGGSGAATAITQILMACVLCCVVFSAARTEGAHFLPQISGLLTSMKVGLPLFLRTASLRVTILLTIFVATALGPLVLASYQVVNALWGLVAYILDALAIASQSLIGFEIGAGNKERTHIILRRSLHWAIMISAIVGILLAALGYVIAPIFGAHGETQFAVALGCGVCGVLLPVAGIVYTLDGVLIGAGEGTYLAWAGLANLLAYAPCAVAVYYYAPHSAWGSLWLWLSFTGVFMGMRLATTWHKARRF